MVTLTNMLLGNKNIVFLFQLHVHPTPLLAEQISSEMFWLWKNES